MANKYSKINFPFFGLFKKPYLIKYELKKILIQRTYGSHLETIDDKSIKGDYFARLATLDHRVHFDVTCKNIQELVYSNPKWGMDYNAMPYDLSKQEIVPANCGKVVKVRNNNVWIKDISYPFKIPTNESLVITEDIYATLIKIKDEWYLKEFMFEPKKITYMIL